MENKTYFYTRVSIKDQNTLKQEAKAKEHNIPLENVYIEEASDSNVKDRPVLNNLIATIKNGDKLIVDSINKFAINTKDLLNLVEQLNNKDVIFVSIKEAINTATPTGIFMLTIFRAITELERDYIKERQADGIELAKKEGKYKGRKPIEYPKQWEKYYKMWKADSIKAVDVMKILDLKKTTFYKLVKEYEPEKIKPQGSEEATLSKPVNKNRRIKD